MAEWTEFRERQGTRAPSGGSMGAGGRMSVLGVVDDDQLDDLLRNKLERAEPSTTHPGLTRTLPVAHPRYPWFFLDHVASIDGVSYRESTPGAGEEAPGSTDPYDLPLEAPALPVRAAYREYEVRLEFQARGWAHLQDDTVPTSTLTWHDADLVTGSSEDEQSLTIAHEWERYVTWFAEPAAEYLTAQQGQFLFRTSNTTTLPAGGIPVDLSVASHGQIRMLVRSRTWKLRWYKVPYSYVLSEASYFDKLQGHVNQFEWQGFQPGTALLQSVRLLDEPYTPPFPDLLSYGGVAVPSQYKLCDLEFTFLWRDPPLGEEYSFSTTDRPSYIARGHNLAPFALTGKWFYVETRGQGSQDNRPIYPSLPMELLFQNPDFEAP